MLIYALNENQQHDIQNLYELCCTKERLTLDPIPKESNLFYIQYEESRLICFASCIFADNDIEVRAITHPDFRQKGYFRKILNELKELYPKRTILLPWDGKNKMTRRCYESLEAKPEPAEYLLSYLVYHPFLSSFYNSIELIEESDSEILAQLHSQIFDSPIKDSKQYIQYFSKAGQAYRIQWSGQIIGMCYLGKIHISPETQSWYLYGFGILPKYRKKGLAIQTLQRFNHKLQEGEQIVVQVSEQNTAAFHLYTKFGFGIHQMLVWYIL